MFDEKQRRRDRWNQKKNFHKKDRFQNKRSHGQHDSDQYNQFDEDYDETFVPAPNDKEVDN